jgi:hypothetical protein
VNSKTVEFGRKLIKKQSSVLLRFDIVYTSKAEVKNKWSYTSSPPICLYFVDKDKPYPYGRIPMFQRLASVSGYKCVS